jgi:hypothetical protein
MNETLKNRARAQYENFSVFLRNELCSNNLWGAETYFHAVSQSGRKKANSVRCNARS